MITIQQAIEKCPALRQAGPWARKQAADCGILKRYKKNELIFREREEVDRIYFVVSGYVALFRLNCHCDRRIIFICGNGELLNEIILENPKASNSAQAFADVTVLSFSRNQFMELMQGDLAFSKAVFDSAAKKIRRLYHQIANTSNMFLLERQVASKLWKAARDFGVRTQEGVLIPFDMPVTFLADMAGSKRESVSRALRVLKAKGVLTVKRNKFLIPDMDKLKEIVHNKNEKSLH